MLDKYTQAIIDEIDWSIREHRNYGAYDFPVDEPDEEGVVTPIYSTYDEERGAVFILEIKPSNGNSSFVVLTQSDGGMTIHRTQLKNDSDTLMFETDEGWSRLVD